MLIEIGKDIVEAAQRGDEEALRILNYLGMAFRNKKHIVFSEPIILKDILKIKDLPLETLNVFVYILGKYTTVIKPLLDELQFRVKLMLSGRSEKLTDMLLINLNSFRNIELYEETHLLAENLFDCKFYHQIGLHYIQEKRLKEVSLSSFLLQGGGAASCRVYREEAYLKQHFCLAIMDSDKGYPKCNKVLDTTYGKVKKEENSLNPLNCMCEKLNYTREVENLIPYSYLRTKYSNMELIKTGVDLSYIDIKQGLEPKLLWFSDAVDYYRKLFSAVPAVLSSINTYELIKRGKKKDDYCAQVKGKVIINGLGDKVTELFLDDNPGNSISRMVPTSDNQRKDWARIGRLVAQWCCAPIIVSTL